MGKLVAYRQVRGDVSELTDEALVAAAATGDPAALAALFRRHSGGVVRFLSRLVGVVRATSMTSCKAPSSRLGMPLRASPERRASRPGYSESHRTWPVNTSAPKCDAGRCARTPPSLQRWNRSNPCHLLWHRQVLRRLESALADLPHELRVVFVLCALEGVPGKEAALVLGIREGTLWRRLHEARASCTNCPVECGVCASCGSCETCANCPDDCGACASCGNAMCEPALGESCVSCADDCGACACDVTTCATGCCAGAVCLPGNTDSACGTDGDACQPCNPNAGETCMLNQCQ